MALARALRTETYRWLYSEIGSAVIKFEDYQYTPDAIPIWNLPAYFLRRDTLEERRQWLAEHLAENPEYAREKARLDAAAGRPK
jgi:hypothetical protein